MPITAQCHNMFRKHLNYTLLGNQTKFSVLCDFWTKHSSDVPTVTCKSNFNLKQHTPTQDCTKLVAYSEKSFRFGASSIHIGGLFQFNIMIAVSSISNAQSRASGQCKRVLLLCSAPINQNGYLHRDAFPGNIWQRLQQQPGSTFDLTWMLQLTAAAAKPVIEQIV